MQNLGLLFVIVLLGAAALLNLVVLAFCIVRAIHRVDPVRQRQRAPTTPVLAPAHH